MDRTGAARIGWNDLPPGHTSSLPSQAICRLQACLQVLYFSFSLHPLLQTSIGNPVGFLSSLCVREVAGVAAVDGARRSTNVASDSSAASAASAPEQTGWESDPESEESESEDEDSEEEEADELRSAAATWLGTSAREKRAGHGRETRFSHF